MSASPVVLVSPAGSLERLSDTLRSLQEISGRTAESVLVTKGGQMLFGNQNPKFGATFKGLYAHFRAQSPADGEIFATAATRGFRLGRRDSGGGLSATAIRRATAMMGGHRSILVNSRADGTGLGFVRAGVQRRVKRVHYRAGRKSFAVSGRGFYEGGAGIAKGADDKVVNLRAVATWFELQLRETGRGFTAAGWLQKRWRKFAKVGFVPEGTAGLRPGMTKSRQFGGTDKRLVNQNPRSAVGLLGDAELSGAPDSGNVTLRLTSYVPGVLALGEARGLFASVINAVTADIESYLARKQAEAIAAALGIDP